MAGLLDPLEGKGLTLRNRIVMPPMQSARMGLKWEQRIKQLKAFYR